MENLVGFEVNAATWFYLSFLLIVAVFFRFGRFWSLRNLDLVLLLSASPGLLFTQKGHPAGDVWLFVVAGLLLVRLGCDSLLTRRPRFEMNMNTPGLAFLGVSTFAYLMTLVIASPPPAATMDTVRRGDHLLGLRDAPSSNQSLAEAGPASSLLAAPVGALSSVVAAQNHDPEVPQNDLVELIAARIMVILAHSAVIGALWCIGRQQFGDPATAVAMGVLYLLLPCTAYDVGKVNHVLPAALIAWAFVAYRRPVVAGSLLGLACGTMFFPVFLLPLWAAFYGRRGALKFGAALGGVAAVLLGTLALTSNDRHSFIRQTIGSIEWNLLEFREAVPAGFWSLYDPAYRIPVFVAFAAMVVFLTIWPRKKTLEDLLSHSTAIIVGTQFWYPQQGGVYLLWYLPMLLMVIFRPRLAHLGPPSVPPSSGVSESAHESAKAAEPLRREPALSGAGSRPLFR